MLNRQVQWLTQSGARSAAVLRIAFMSLLNRGFTVIASLLTVPIVLHHLGAERYGIWMAAIALSTIFALADGGIAVGLTALVSRANGAGDSGRVGNLLGSALAVTAVFAGCFLVIFLIAIPTVNWNAIFNLPDPSYGREAGSVVVVICVGFCLALPANVVRQARFGLLDGAKVNTWELCGSALGFVGLVAAVKLHANLVVIAAVWIGGPTLVRTIAAGAFLAGKGRYLLASFRPVRGDICRTLLASGSVYLVYTLTQAVAVQSDQVLIAHTLGPTAVTTYSIVQRLFNQPQVIVTIFLAAQWPAYGEALGREDYAWIRRHFRQSAIVFTLLAVLVNAGLAFGCNTILNLWVGKGIVASPMLIFSMFGYGVASTVATIFSFFFFSLGLNRRMVLSQLAMAAINLPLTLMLLPKIGISGAAIGTALGYILAIVIPGMLMTDRTLLNLPRLRNKDIKPGVEASELDHA